MSVVSMHDPLNCINPEESDLTGNRVLLLFPHLILPGGALNYMLALTEQLASKGATVGILTLQADNYKYDSATKAEILKIGGPATSSMGYWLFFPFWQRKIRRAILDWHADILIPQVFPANWWAWLYKKKHRTTPVVWVCPEPSAFIHSRHWIEALQPFWKKYLARMLNPILAAVDIRLSLFSDKIVANSKYTAGMIEKTYHRKADAVAYPGVDSTLYHPEQPIKKTDALVSVAKLSRFKRVDFLLRVFSKILKSHPKLTYHIVGEGEEGQNLKRLADELQISEHVVFHGTLDNRRLAALFKSSLLFLHGSIMEPFGMAPLEAIACSTPVIAHRSGGPLEFVNQSCGRLIDSLSEESWCAEINEFLFILKANPDYFDGVAVNAKCFSWKSTLIPALQLIADVIPGK